MSSRSRNIIRQVLDSEKKKGLKVDVSFIDDPLIRALNKKFRKIDRATDVLSFCYGSNEGEILISVETASRNASRYKVSLDDELKRLLIHGCLHILGYDHARKSDRILMRKKEDHYAKKIR